MGTIRIRVVAMPICALLLGFAATVASASEESDRFTLDAEAIAQERAVYGLPTAATDLAALRLAPDPVAAALHIPVTVEEAKAIDLDSRWAFEETVGDLLPSYLSDLADYGGMYFDQANGGILHVQMTEQSDLVNATVRTLVGRQWSDRVRFDVVEHSRADLEAALTTISQDPAAYSRDLRAASINAQQNAIVLHFASSTTPSAAATADLANDLGVKVVVASDGDQTVISEICQSRANCWDPMKGGNEITNGDGAGCTMGFHINVGSDQQFVTAGHCSFEQESDQWLHGTFGLIGSVTNTLYENCGFPLVICKDTLRVQMPDSQSSFLVLGAQLANRTVEGSRLPIQNESFCASLGKSKVEDCGTVFDDWRFDFVDEEGVTVGQSLEVIGIGTQGGDSGSPYYHRASTSSENITAIGTHTARIEENQHRLANRLQNALNSWNATVIHDPD